jgi:hypothetical protein
VLLSNTITVNRPLVDTWLRDSGTGVYNIPSQASLLLVDISGAGGGGGGAMAADWKFEYVVGGQGGQAGAAASLAILLNSDRTTTAIPYSIGKGGFGCDSKRIRTINQGPILYFPVTTVGPRDSGEPTSLGNWITCLGGRYGQSAFFWSDSVSYDSDIQDWRGGGAPGVYPDFAPVIGNVNIGLGLGENNPWDSDTKRGQGVIINRLIDSDKNIIIDVRPNLGYTAGGVGSENANSSEYVSWYATEGDGVGAISAKPGTITAALSNTVPQWYATGGGGGSTQFGFGGAGGNSLQPGVDSSSYNGRDAIVGYGGGGGGAATHTAANEALVHFTKPYSHGKGGKGGKGFIRIRAYR